MYKLKNSSASFRCDNKKSHLYNYMFEHGTVYEDIPPTDLHKFEKIVLRKPGEIIKPIMEKLDKKPKKKKG